MKLRKMKQIVKSGNIVYAEKIGIIEGKIKRLKLRALKYSHNKRKRDYARIMLKAKEWETVIADSFWNLRDRRTL